MGFLGALGRSLNPMNQMRSVKATATGHPIKAMQYGFGQKNVTKPGQYQNPSANQRGNSYGNGFATGPSRVRSQEDYNIGPSSFGQYNPPMGFNYTPKPEANPNGYTSTGNTGINGTFTGGYGWRDLDPSMTQPPNINPSDNYPGLSGSDNPQMKGGIGPSPQMDWGSLMGSNPNRMDNWGPSGDIRRGKYPGLDMSSLMGQDYSQIGGSGFGALNPQRYSVQDFSGQPNHYGVRPM